MQNFTEMSSCLSEADVKLSQINVLFSEINQTMSTSPVQSSLLLLPRIQIILSEINQFVQYTQQLRDEDIDDDCSSEADDECCQDASLEWDNNHYYNLYYNNTSVEDGNYASISSYSEDGDYERFPVLEADYEMFPVLEAD